KTEQSIMKAIEKWENREERVLLVDALETAEPLRAYLAAHPRALSVQLVGSLRRWKETVADLDLLVESDDAAALIAHFLAFPQVVKTVTQGSDHVRARLSSGLCVDLGISDREHLAPTLVRLTGSVNHVQQLETLLHNNKHSFTDPAADEAEVYRRAG